MNLDSVSFYLKHQFSANFKIATRIVFSYFEAALALIIARFAEVEITVFIRRVITKLITVTISSLTPMEVVPSNVQRNVMCLMCDQQTNYLGRHMQASKF